MHIYKFSLFFSTYIFYCFVNTKNIYEKPKWVEVKNINKGDVVGIPVNNKSIIINNEFNLDFSNNNERVKPYLNL